MTPNELMSAILKAPVDLLWNGGIGTYVKASNETHADVGDRANNGLRVDGRDLRCKVVGEGGNLGLTQLGRIEAAQHGVLLNTDFIDNSAGVDTSDHEVNIKILLNGVVQAKKLSMDARNKLLADMTGEVAELVLWDNYRQNQAISLMERMSVSRWVPSSTSSRPWSRRACWTARSSSCHPTPSWPSARRAGRG